MKPFFPKPAKLPALELALIIRDRGCQRRDSEDKDVVARYADLYRAGGPDALPPIVVFREPGESGPSYRLADGFHRHRAATKAGITALPALVYEGDSRLALLYALSANGEHGLPTTLAERRANAETLLKDEEWRTWSDRQIALHAHVSPQLVGKLRKTVPGAQVSVRTTKDGKKQTVTNSRQVAKQKTAEKQSGVEALDDDARRNKRIEAIDILSVQIGHFADWFSVLSSMKKKILAALWYAEQQGESRLRSRAQLTDDVGTLDVHPGQLIREGLISGDATRGYELTPKAIVDIGDSLREREKAEREDAEEKAKASKRIHPMNTDERGDDDEPEDLTAPPVPTTAPATTTKTQTSSEALNSLIVHRLVDGKIKTPSTRNLIGLAVILGVNSSSTDERWSELFLDRADHLLAKDLAEGIADLITTGGSIIAKLPALPDLCRMFGIDYESLRIQAEREVKS